MKNLIKGFLVLFLAGIIFSCSEDNSVVNAEKITQTQFSSIPGYEWFSNAKDTYTPVENIVTEIKSTYNASQHRFVIFVKPSCSCNDKYYQTPRFLKILQLANISDENLEIWTMTKVTNLQPYKDIVALKDLPAIIIFKNNVPVYSVTDTINAMQAYEAGTEYSVEQALLLGLQK